jgi:ATP-dependent Lhr-like helicase
MDMGDKGKIHSNIPNSKRLVVIDVNSKRIVGEVQYPVDEIFLFGGSIWRIVNILGDKIYVKPEKGEASAIKFKSCDSNGAFYYFLPGRLRE